MQFVPNQVMGYDRAITVFSPDGRILQVEYAKKAVDLGALALGLVCKDRLILMADRYRIDKLLVAEAVRKISEIDDHILMTAAGLISDARILVRKARIKSQQHKITYGESIDIEMLVKYLADTNQAYTQYGGIRPFGVSFLIGGVERSGPKLFMTEPSGIYFQYKAKAVGMNAADANKVLESKYKEGMSTKEGLKLSIQAFKKALGKDFSYTRLESSIATKEGIKKLSETDLKKL